MALGGRSAKGLAGRVPGNAVLNRQSLTSVRRVGTPKETGQRRLPVKVLGGIAVALACALLLAGQGFDSTVQAQNPPIDYDADGDGLIEIATVAQLNAIRWDLDGDGAADAGADAARYAAAFPDAATSPRMGCDSGCTGYELRASLSLSGAGDALSGWAPIGSSSNPFNATFDAGRSFPISGLHIYRPAESDIGLFGETGTGSVIRNVRLVGVNVTGKERVGALVGKNAGSISAASAAGSVQGSGRVGGLVGLNSDVGGGNAISGSAASVAVTASGSRVGGLVGQNLAAPVSDSHASGNVSGVNWVGGLIGSNYDQNAWDTSAAGLNAISRSTASGTVNATGNTVGGLAGFNNGPISDSDALGATVTGGLNWVGGLVGSNNDPGADGTNTIVRSTASANVTATASNGTNTGGLVGWNNGPISDSYARGDVRGGSQLGGLVGANYGDITDCGATGAVGDATSTGSTIGGLAGLNKEASISGSVASGAVIAPAGNTIGGLVGRNEGSITESAATGAVTGGTSTAGGLVGFQRSTGSIDSSHASGSVTSSGDRVGGLLGWNDGLIRSSYATGAVVGADNVGGLVGELVGSVVASHSSGSVSGSGVGVGGLIGCARSASPLESVPSSVRASYATGAVAGSAATTGGLVGIAEPAYLDGGDERAAPRFASSYWDTQRSTQSVGIGSQDLRCSGSVRDSALDTATYRVVGLTTSELQTPTGYTGIYATWNVDMDDGNATVTAGWQPWDFGGGSDDPRLRGPSNPPTFSASTLTRSVAEDAAVGTGIGDPVTASDDDADTLTYSLVGAGGRAFDIDSTTGQLKVGAVLDVEARSTYRVTVQASDGKLVAFRDVEVTVTGANEPPSFPTAAATRSVVENTAAASAFGDPITATDPDSASLTYTLEGPDAAAFDIDASTGRLRTRAALDYERRTSYAVVVKASDGSHSVPIAVAITVTNGNDPGELRVSSLQPQVGTALTATLTDPDGSVSITGWQWAAGGNPINTATSASYTPAAGDVGDSLSVTVTYNDALMSGNTATLSLSNIVRAAPTGTNTAPAFAAGAVTRSVEEHTAAGTDIGEAVTAMDTDSSDVLTYSLAGAHAASFDIDPATGQLKTEAALDAETRTSYSVTVVARDPSLASASRAVTITVTGVDEAPAVSGNLEIDYAEGGSNAVATYTAQDPESSTTPIIWSLAGADSAAFTITGGTLSFGSSPDYENPTDAGRDNVYHVTVQASDDSTNPNTGSLNVTVTITPVEETPVVTGPTMATFPENTSGVVAVYTADDPERASITWSLAGSNHSAFEISSNGRLRRASRTPRDYESPMGSGGNTYSVTVQASDGTRTASRALTVTVTDVDEQPVLSGPATVEYDEGGSGPIGTYRHTDPERAVTVWGALAGPDAGAFEFVNGVLSLRTTASFPSPDFEDPQDAGGDNVYQVSVQALDSATPTPNTGARNVVVIIGNVDEDGKVGLNTAQPTIGIEITATVSDDDGVVSVNSWQWQRDGVNIFGATSGTYTPSRGDTSINPHVPTDVGASLKVIASYTDAHGTGKTVETTAANPVTESPGTRSPMFPPAEDGRREVAEHTPAGRNIGAPVAATDEDVGDPNFDDALIYLLSGSDAASFDIDEASGQLLTKAILDREAQSSYSVIVTARDSAALEATQAVTIHVTDVNEGPVLEAGRAAITYPENSTEIVETYTASDPEGAAIDWALSGADSGAFTIIGGMLRFNDPPNFESKSTYRVTVHASDGPRGTPGILTDSLAVTVNVVDVNEAPELTGGEASIDYPENGTGTVETYRASDPERASIVWSLAGRDRDAFTISGGTLRFNDPPDFEDQGAYLVVVEASDGPLGASATLTGELLVTVAIVNVEEPGALSLSSLQPQVDTPLTATLTDEDGVSPGNITWRWESGGVEISGAVLDNYSPVASDVGKRLRVTASYTDGEASGKTAEATSARAVRARPSSNAAPTFPSTETGARDVGQNTLPGVGFGARVVATDSDSDILTYSLEPGGDRAFFDIDQATAQLRTKTRIDRVIGDSYTVTVAATDPSGDVARQTMTISVTAGPTPPIGGGGFFIGAGGGGGGGGPSPSTVDFEWTVKHDLEALDGGQTLPTGMWSDGATLWLLDNPEGAGDAVFAYDRATGERLKDREFPLDERNRAPRGMWSDGKGVVWVSDSGRDYLFAYDLTTGERLEERDIDLHERNADARGILSDGAVMWVLDDRGNALFAYDLKSGALLAEYALDSANGSPVDLSSDGVTLWVSDPGSSPRRLFAYRLPTREELQATGEGTPLERLRDEDFTELSSASNNSPRGIWAEGDLMYVADASDARVYTYNMPDAIDARLASLTLEGVDIGEFDPDHADYEGVIAEGVTETTVVAEAMQRRTNVAIDPPDADGDDINGHQVSLEGVEQIGVTVTSADGTRIKVYRVQLEVPEVHVALEAGWNSLEWPGAMGASIVEALDEAGLADIVVAVYRWDEAAGRWLGYFPGRDGIPVLNTLMAFTSGQTYWIAVEEPATWAVPLSAGDQN